MLYFVLHVVLLLNSILSLITHEYSLKYNLQCIFCFLLFTFANFLFLSLCLLNMTFAVCGKAKRQKAIVPVHTYNASQSRRQMVSFTLCKCSLSSIILFFTHIRIYKHTRTHTHTQLHTHTYKRPIQRHDTQSQTYTNVLFRDYSENSQYSQLRM